MSVLSIAYLHCPWWIGDINTWNSFLIILDYKKSVKLYQTKLNCYKWFLIMCPSCLIAWHKAYISDCFFLYGHTKAIIYSLEKISEKMSPTKCHPQYITVLVTKCHLPTVSYKCVGKTRVRDIFQSKFALCEHLAIPFGKFFIFLTLITTPHSK